VSLAPFVGQGALGRKGGRPSKDDAELLGEKIIDAATSLFLSDGYGTTSIEAIARAAKISKRTFYARFPDKAALLGAVIHRIIEQLRPADAMPLFEGDDINEVLCRLGEIILRASVAPTALALHRLVVAEAVRFPELAVAVADEGSRAEAIAGIAGILRRHVDAGRLDVADAEFAAEQFMELVLAIPQRRALGLGTAMTDAQLVQWVKDSVGLFLNGCRRPVLGE